MAARGSKPTVSEKPGKISRWLLSRAVVLHPRLVIPRPVPVSMNVFFISKDYDASVSPSSAASQTDTPAISRGLVSAPVISCWATYISTECVTETVQELGQAYELVQY